VTSSKKISFTVGIPIFNKKEIAWLPLESLSRQEGNYGNWELIVAEEQTPDAFGELKVRAYEEKLKKTGCVKITYLPLKKWINLSEKWKLLIDQSNNLSDFFVFCSADEYSNPRRLEETFLAFSDKKIDWFQYKKSLYYHLFKNKLILMDQDYPGYQVKTAWFFSARLPLLRDMKTQKKLTSNDQHLFRQCQRKKKSHLLVKEGSDELCLSHMHVFGINNLAKKSREKDFDCPSRAPFLPANISLLNNFPPDIVAKLKRITNPDKNIAK